MKAEYCTFFLAFIFCVSGCLQNTSYKTINPVKQIKKPIPQKTSQIPHIPPARSHSLIAERHTTKAAFVAPYKGRLHQESSTIELTLGDIAGKWDNHIPPLFCKEIADRAFRKYPDFQNCNLNYDLVVANQVLNGDFKFHRTPTGSEFVH